jgi:hypothetical protein
VCFSVGCLPLRQRTLIFTLVFLAACAVYIGHAASPQTVCENHHRRFGFGTYGDYYYMLDNNLGSNLYDGRESLLTGLI